ELENDQSIKVEIAGKVVVNSKGATSGSMKMVKGKKYPIVVTYVKEGSEFLCSLKVEWSWAGQAASVVGGENLVHSDARENELKAIMAAADNDDDDGDEGVGGDGDDKELSFSDLPAAVQATVKAHLNGAVIDDIDSGTDDGKRVYEVEAKLDDDRELNLTILMNGELYKKRVDLPLNPREKMPAKGVIPPSGDTVALWLFDESDYPHTTITDASEYAKADLCLMDGGRMVPGKFGNALQVSGTDYALCYAGFAGKVSEEELRERDGKPSALWGPTEASGALLDGLAGKKWTIEVWLNLSSLADGVTIFDMGRAYELGVTVRLAGGNVEVVNNYAGVKAVCPAKLSAGKWQHVAVVRDGSGAVCFVDGKKQSAGSVTEAALQAIPDLEKPDHREHGHRGFKPMSFEQRRQKRFNVSVGSDRHNQNSMKGLVDEMRILKVARYSGNFKPTSFSKNYGPKAPLPPVANGPGLLFDPDPVSIPLKFGARKYVFIDDAIIETKSNVKMTMNQPGNKQEIGKDFGIRRSSLRPSVWDVDGVVYMALPEGYSSRHGITYLATSKDGLNFKMQGLIMPDTPMYGSFFKDLNPATPPEHKYKVNSFVSTRGMYFYTSPDGINWRRNEVCQLPLRSGGEGECFWDDQRGRYASYIKRDGSFKNKECPRAGGRVGVGFWTKEILKPWPFHKMNTPYFEGYPFPSVTCEGPGSFPVTEAGEVYRIRAIKYPWAPDVYLAFVWRYSSENDEVRHIDLGVSRDGETWSWFGTNWYIPLGEQEEELTLYGLIRRGDEIWQYVDEGGAHGGDAQRVYCRYKQRLDGFVSLDAGTATGTATTLPLLFEGSKLVLNIKAMGSAKVAITDKDGKEIKGFGLVDCDVIKADSTEKVVTWKGKSSVKLLAGKLVRLKFEMKESKLYAFEFKN
ncbi:MAG: LamG domain-containing protein, partial [Planctomycetota bacterium]